ncbi:O-fucosyltransferase 38 isoform X3 [Diospyros lotus]|uniref:O-fucosyltransferase 38 isoform X3 n=1 Tax=Diospyros lotus TaxID=55363 RepID=UPI0022514BDC|nr:O-fucosyltransferase 38 isoform X3 [Diospyros lotus]
MVTRRLRDGQRLKRWLKTEAIPMSEPRWLLSFFKETHLHTLSPSTQSFSLPFQSSFLCSTAKTFWKMNRRSIYFQRTNPNGFQMKNFGELHIAMVFTHVSNLLPNIKITDMVAVAHVMNATLVIPQLDKRSFWQDSSTFSDVFDEVHFISSLQGDVRIVKELPKKLESVPHARKHFTSWSGMSYYEEMIHLWNEFQVIHVAKSDSRLANNDLPLDIQRLRCRVMYDALRFSPPIENLGKKLVERLRFQGGRYIALHLRYEKDMLSFTGCTTGLTDAESEELRIMRENTNHWKMKKINSTEQRNAGLCPLTPKEVGIFLQALSYPPSTLIYIAAGEIYGGNIHLSELKDRFPNVILKEMIATQEELRAFVNHASQTAALDYIVSVESDVFIPSYSGNMARSVEGHRRFLGHRKTITPDREGLVELFDKLETGQLKEGTTLSDLVMQLHKNRQGSPRKRGGPLPGLKGRARLRTEESFYQNPYPECICGPKSGLQ